MDTLSLRGVRGYPVITHQHGIDLVQMPLLVTDTEMEAKTSFAPIFPGGIFRNRLQVISVPSLVKEWCKDLSA